jgi:hypothetical protein
LICEEPRSWDDARAYCQAHGYDLVTIESVRENDQLAVWAHRRSDNENYYIGLRYRDGALRWASSGEVDHLRLWEHDEPDGDDCVNLDTDSDRWEDRECDDEEHFICEAR